MLGVSLSQNSKVVVLAYADDICVAIANQKDVSEVSRCLTQFELASTARVNWKKKSVAFWVGPRLPSSFLPVLPGGIQWSSEGFKYLGLFLGIEAYEQKNWENFLEKN